MNTIDTNTKLSFKQLIEIVKKLPPEKKQLLNESIWDDSMPIPEEHKSIVRKRISKSLNNPERMIDWDLASQKLQG